MGLRSSIRFLPYTKLENLKYRTIYSNYRHFSQSHQIFSTNTCQVNQIFTLHTTRKFEISNYLIQQIYNLLHITETFHNITQQSAQIQNNISNYLIIRNSFADPRANCYLKIRSAFQTVEFFLNAFPNFSTSFSPKFTVYFYLVAADPPQLPNQKNKTSLETNNTFVHSGTSLSTILHICNSNQQIFYKQFKQKFVFQKIM
eukprot:TRINITY_DN9982_c0_g1_i1.p1 TRINITY_DN9982_c0_g1~~TRINITY_DN9982_c0_g1_i1.p1  ORF type:complete len:201 (+),score=-10.03 TRINITY_DN9982_c0_g1_i1:85-687(+)